MQAPLRSRQAQDAVYDFRSLGEFGPLRREVHGSRCPGCQVAHVTSLRGPHPSGGGGAQCPECRGVPVGNRAHAKDIAALPERSIAVREKWKEVKSVTRPEVLTIHRQ